LNGCGTLAGMTQVKIDVPKKTFNMHLPGTRMVIIGWVLALLALAGTNAASFMSPAFFIGGIILISAGHVTRTLVRRAERPAGN
jgi:hypothetical protein